MTKQTNQSTTNLQRENPPTETREIKNKNIIVCLHCHGNLSRFDELLYAYVCKDIECDLYNLLQLGILWEEK